MKFYFNSEINHETHQIRAHLKTGIVKPPLTTRKWVFYIQLYIHKWETNLEIYDE